MHMTDHPDGEAAVRSRHGELRFAPRGDLTDLRGERWSVDGDLAVLALDTRDGRVGPSATRMRSAAIWSALRCRTAGEVLASAAPGWEFLDWGRAHHIGGGSHGALHANDSLGSLIWCGTGPDSSRRASSGACATSSRWCSTTSASPPERGRYARAGARRRRAGFAVPLVASGRGSYDAGTSRGPWASARAALYRRRTHGSADRERATRRGHFARMRWSVASLLALLAAMLAGPVGGAAAQVTELALPPRPDVAPAGYTRTVAEVTRIARGADVVSRETRSAARRPYSRAYTAGHGRWQVSFYVPPDMAGRRAKRSRRS